MVQEVAPESQAKQVAFKSAVVLAVLVELHSRALHVISPVAQTTSVTAPVIVGMTNESLVAVFVNAVVQEWPLQVHETELAGTVEPICQFEVVPVSSQITAWPAEMGAVALISKVTD
jgi:hypothetical protein